MNLMNSDSLIYKIIHLSYLSRNFLKKVGGKENAFQDTPDKWHLTWLKIYERIFILRVESLTTNVGSRTIFDGWSMLLSDILSSKRSMANLVISATG